MKRKGWPEWTKAATDAEGRRVCAFEKCGKLLPADVTDRRAFCDRGCKARHWAETNPDSPLRRTLPSRAIYLPPEMWDALTAIAEREGVAISGVIRMAVGDYLGTDPDHGAKDWAAIVGRHRVWGAGKSGPLKGPRSMAARKALREASKGNDECSEP